MSAEPVILVVDDEPEMSALISDALGARGYRVHTRDSGQAAIAALRRELFDAVITDLRMRDVDGLDVLAAAKEVDPTLPVLIMTAFGAVDSAVEAIKRGASQYLSKPFQMDELQVFLQRALDERRVRAEHGRLLRQASQTVSTTAILGDTPAMRGLRELVGRVALASSPVLIQGESGTGKEMVARALHASSPRAAAPFVAVNCTALPADLLESELFGHLKGAFTGASTARRGLFLEAHQGSLFLDEIGDMPLELQARLLRVLEDGQVRAVGSDGARSVDVRVIAATHQDLDAAVRAGTFRRDLFYRLNVVPLRVPPLRERSADVPALALHFLSASRRRNPRSPLRALSPEALRLLSEQAWPGNVRELENAIERLTVLATGDEATAADLSLAGVVGDPSAASFLGVLETPLSLRDMERRYIAWVLARCGGNKTRAAELLGVDVSTLHRRERAGGSSPG